MDAPANGYLQCARVAVQRWGGDPESVRMLDSGANAVCAVHVGERERILRLATSGYHDASSVQAEIEWIRHLTSHGIPCASALVSSDGRWVEIVEGPEGPVPATLFERAPGGPVVERDCAPSLFEQIGELMAWMHGVSIDYHRGHRSRPAPHRPHWHENEPHARFRESVSVEDWALCREWDRLDQVLRALPATKQCYGLVHADIHRGNFVVHEGRIYLFDFDDCCIQWFASDLANTIYYALWDRRFEPIADRSSFAQEFASHLLAGYRRHRALGDDEIAWIPDLLEYRELCVYGFSRRRWGSSRWRPRCARGVTTSGSESLAGSRLLGWISMRSERAEVLQIARPMMCWRLVLEVERDHLRLGIMVTADRSAPWGRSGDHPPEWARDEDKPNPHQKALD